MIHHCCITADCQFRNRFGRLGTLTSSKESCPQIVTQVASLSDAAKRASFPMRRRGQVVDRFKLHGRNDAGALITVASTLRQGNKAGDHLFWIEAFLREWQYDGRKHDAFSHHRGKQCSRTRGRVFMIHVPCFFILLAQSWGIQSPEGDSPCTLRRQLAQARHQLHRAASALARAA